MRANEEKVRRQKRVGERERDRKKGGRSMLMIRVSKVSIEGGGEEQ